MLLIVPSSITIHQHTDFIYMRRGNRAIALIMGTTQNLCALLLLIFIWYLVFNYCNRFFLSLSLPLIISMSVTLSFYPPPLLSLSLCLSIFLSLFVFSLSLSYPLNLSLTLSHFLSLWLSIDIEI